MLEAFDGDVMPRDVELPAQGMGQLEGACRISPRRQGNGDRMQHQVLGRTGHLVSSSEDHTAMLRLVEGVPGHVLHLSGWRGNRASRC